MPLAPGLSLVTGATGFVGAAVARALLREPGQRVRVLARPQSNRRNLEGLDVEVAEGALEDAASLAAAVAGCRYLFHVAADYRLWVPDVAAMFRANIDGTRDLMLAALAAGVERIVYTSSVATLGLVSGGVADEATPSGDADMVGPYKRSKFIAERVVRELVAERGLPAVIVNPSTPVGPGDVRPTPTGRIIIEAAKGRMPGYVDTGLNLVHVDDVAAGHVAALHRGRIGERYILGGQDVLLGDMLRDIARRVGRSPPKVRLPRQLIFPIAYGAEAIAQLTGREPFVTVTGLKLAKDRMFFSSAKAEGELDYRARPYGEAIAHAIAWFRQHGYLKA